MHGQSLDSLITKKIVQHPDTEINSLQLLKPKTDLEAAKNYYLLGKCYAFLNHEDIAMDYFVKAKKQFEKAHAAPFAIDVALEAYLLLSSQQHYDAYTTHFLDEYFSYAQKTKSNVRMAYAYNEFAKQAYSLFDTKTRSNTHVLDSAYAIYKKALYYAGRSGNTKIKAKLYGNIGTMMNTWQKFDLARKSFINARVYIGNTGDGFERFANYYNYANSYYLEQHYEKAANYFIQAEDISMPYYRDKAKRKLYEQLAATYDSLNDNANRRKYEILFTTIDAKIKDREQNIKIHDIDVKYQVETKDRQISVLQKFKMKFEQNRIIFGILLFVVFLLALYSFIRWRKVDLTRKKLEQENEGIQAEHTKTVEQLEKVRQLVIEDHIVLKNKTRLYLDKLMYISADDHYLNFVPEQGKSQFLRGKLSEITTELPPNFIRCHRSYIVNSNYIKSSSSKGIVLHNNKEIPVSRSFKI